MCRPARTIRRRKLIDNMSRIPNFFIVGKPKAGTTALHHLLAQHPDIFMSSFKEPHHFHLEHVHAGMDRNRGMAGLAYKDRDKYLELFEDAIDEKIVGESSTGYLYSKSAAREIAKFNPDAKILMVLREPVDFMHSFHSQLLRSANENEPDFRAALKLEESRKHGENIPFTATYPDNLLYIDQARYAAQVRRFFDAFDSHNIKVVIYEDLRADNLRIFREILEFLEVDPDFTPQFRDVNQTRRVRFPKLAGWLVFLADKRKYPVQAWMPDWLLGPIRGIMRQVFYTTGPREQLDPELRLELARKLKPDVMELGELLGIDLAKKWSYDQI
jgi:hypothetical protein